MSLASSTASSEAMDTLLFLKPPSDEVSPAQARDRDVTGVDLISSIYNATCIMYHTPKKWMEGESNALAKNLVISFRCSGLGILV